MQAFSRLLQALRDGHAALQNPPVPWQSDGVTVQSAGVVPTRDQLVAWYDGVSAARLMQELQDLAHQLPAEARIGAGAVLAAIGLVLVVRSYRHVRRPTQADLIRRVANAAQTRSPDAGAARQPAASEGIPVAAAADVPKPTNGRISPSRTRDAEPPPASGERPEQPRALAAQAFLTADQFNRGHMPWAVPLGQDLLRIGRHQENDIQLEDKTVHRYHALLHRSPDGDFLIRDLSGTAGNGVYVNGARIEQAALRPGDLVELGAVRLRFQQQRPS